MEEVKQYLQQKAAKADRWAEHLERQVYDMQKQIAVSRAEAGQYREMAEEFRRLAKTYDSKGPAQAQEGAATAFSEGGQGVDATSDEKGVGGREIKHVHVDEEPVGDALPDAVWVSADDLMSYQVPVASDIRQDVIGMPEYLLQVAMLTAGQRAKYCKPAQTYEDHPDEAEVEWFTEENLAPGQKQLALDYRVASGQMIYAIHHRDLTPDQKAKYCKPAPTSDAADFGGLPG